ncbi:hypothetical protein F2Q69_00016656 [Brassica cretica]|uniref:Reverse transcriptase zinc-binding domain-containing protein n=1 Tax=Brassica cretica TaxID=69181 RepID=A0A8S9R4A2_BRACR|nr:hypothetical protein F2Q69_00016656 [Brassica cretica]
MSLNIYMLIDSSTLNRNADRAPVNWLKHVWNVKTAPKFKDFLWRILKQALPVSANLERRGVARFSCKKCNGQEDDLHVLLNCTLAEEVWALTPIAQRPSSSLTSMAELIKQGSNFVPLPPAGATIMQATINANRLSSFRERLSAGTMYSISGFDVARCAQNFKLTDSSLMIRFNDSTEFDVLTDPVSPLPVEGFWFRNQTELVGLANTNNQLPDIIGEISVVKSTVSEPPEDKNRVMVTVKLESDVSVTLSLFDCQAVLFHKKLEGMRDDPKVIVATNINPKMIGGILLIYSVLVARDTGLTPAAPLLRAYAKVESMTIAELNNFVITAPSQVITQELNQAYVGKHECSSDRQKQPLRR